MSSVALRPVTSADSELCFQLHKAAMGDYIAAIWGWDDATQRQFHKRSFESARWQIITVEGADAGILGIDGERVPGAVFLSRIEIHPDFQGKGIGSRLIRAVLDGAHSRDQHVVLAVLNVDSRARALYERLGFAEVARPGDNNVKIRMMCCGGRAG